MSLMLPILLAASEVFSGGTTQIFSGRAYYDHKENFACLSDKVRVVDSQYQLYADRAFVYTGASNDLKRIVALDNVAITNGTRRAYGAKATYHRESGLVVLYAGEDAPAEVRDEDPSGNRVMRGRKIKFWTGTRQIEVIDAELSAPSRGAGELKGLFGR